MPHRPRGESEFEAKARERSQRFFGITLSTLIGAGILIGIGKMFAVWRGWQRDFERERQPWERLS